MVYERSLERISCRVRWGLGVASEVLVTRNHIWLHNVRTARASAKAIQGSLVGVLRTSSQLSTLARRSIRRHHDYQNETS